MIWRKREREREKSVWLSKLKIYHSLTHSNGEIIWPKIYQRFFFSQEKRSQSIKQRANEKMRKKGKMGGEGKQRIWQDKSTQTGRRKKGAEPIPDIDTSGIELGLGMNWRNWTENWIFIWERMNSNCNCTALQDCFLPPVCSLFLMHTYIQSPHSIRFPFLLSSRLVIITALTMATLQKDIAVRCAIQEEKERQGEWERNRRTKVQKNT